MFTRLDELRRAQVGYDDSRMAGHRPHRRRNHARPGARQDAEIVLSVVQPAGHDGRDHPAEQRGQCDGPGADVEGQPAAGVGALIGRSSRPR
jgi:hypothetical protein